MHPNLRATSSLAFLSRRVVGSVRPLPNTHILPSLVPARRSISTAPTAMAPGPMSSQPPPEPGADFNIVMIGAGVSLLCHRRLALISEHHVRFR